MQQEQNNHESNSSKALNSSKSQKLLIKLVLVLSVTFFGYFGFKFYTLQKFKNHHDSNIENSNDIFDLAQEALNDEMSDDGHNFSELSAQKFQEKLNEGGAEFIYQLILKNQLQINEISGQVKFLKEEISKYKNQEKIVKIILSYVDFRDQIFAGKEYQNKLSSLELLAANDQNITTKIGFLKNSLPHFVTKEVMQKNFSNLIPEIIKNKNANKVADETKTKESWLDKIKNYLSSLIVIRRIDGNKTDEIDAKIVKIEEFLAQENYQEVLIILMELDPTYHNILQEFLLNVNSAIEVRKMDQEILTYLKSLS